MFGALDGTATKLVLLARAPSIYRAVACKCEYVVGTASELCDLLQSVYKNRLVGDSDDFSLLPSKPDDSFVPLR